MSLEEIPDFPPEDLTSDENSSRSLLNRIVEDTLIKFRGTLFVEHPNMPVSVYDTFHAASDALLELDIDAFDLFKILTQQTEQTPEVLSTIDVKSVNMEEWDEFIHSINYAIISAELCERYPEVVEEEQKRQEILNQRRNS